MAKVWKCDFYENLQIRTKVQSYFSLLMPYFTIASYNKSSKNSAKSKNLSKIIIRTKFFDYSKD